MKFSLVELAKGLNLFAEIIPDDQSVIMHAFLLTWFTQAVISCKMSVQRHVR
jgi:hypothetical protein